MSTDRTLGAAPLPVPDLVPGGAGPAAAPRPVPAGATPPAVVSDDDRNRYGLLLDHAAERGLLSPSEYQARLGDLADATTEEELRRIVTELPAFGSPGDGAGTLTRSGRPTGSGAGVDAAALDSALWAALTPTRQRRGSGNPWVALAIVVVVLLVAIVALALVGAHLAHAHHTGAVPVVDAAVSRLRL